MTNEEFADCLDRYGTNLQDWPTDARAAGRAVADGESGRRQLEAARAFDAMLAEALAVPEPLGLKQRILANADARMDFLSWLVGPLWRPVVMAAAPLALGFTLGFSYPETEGLAELADEVAIIAFSEIQQVNGAGEF